MKTLIKSIPGLNNGMFNLIRVKPKLLISRKENTHIIHPTIYFDQIPVAEVNSHKHLGLFFSL